MFISFRTALAVASLCLSTALAAQSLVDTVSTISPLTVTANKRTSTASRVPAALTVLPAERVVSTRTWGLEGLTALVPNYLYQELGVPFQQVQSIRGVQVFSENPAVATYVDDVNQFDILANGFTLTDVERIEVLRGPQGTLYGRNALGGVVNIITRRPGNRTEGRAEVSVGNLGLRRYALALRTPLVKDKLFLGLSGLYQARDGYWTNDTTGTVAPVPQAQGRTVGGQTSGYGNVYLRYLAGDRFSATLNVKGQVDDSDATGFFVSQTDPASAAANPGTINLGRVGEHRRDVLNSSFVLKYYGEEFTVTSVSANQRIGLSFRDVYFPGFYHSFFDDEIGERLPPQVVWSQELRVSSTGEGPWRYTAGAYAFDRVSYEPSTNLAFELAPETYAIFRNRGEGRGGALFGEIEYDLTEQLTLTGGLRYDRERRRATFNRFGDATFLAGTLVQTNRDTAVAGTYAALTPKLALRYAPDGASQAYATYSRDFRAGGVNAQRFAEGTNVRQTFDPEYSDNSEIGYKRRGDTWGVAAAAFFIS